MSLVCWLLVVLAVCIIVAILGGLLWVVMLIDTLFDGENG